MTREIIGLISAFDFAPQWALPADALRRAAAGLRDELRRAASAQPPAPRRGHFAAGAARPAGELPGHRAADGAHCAGAAIRGAALRHRRGSRRGLGIAYVCTCATPFVRDRWRNSTPCSGAKMRPEQPFDPPAAHRLMSPSWHSLLGALSRAVTGGGGGALPAGCPGLRATCSSTAGATRPRGSPRVHHRGANRRLPVRTPPSLFISRIARRAVLRRPTKLASKSGTSNRRRRRLTARPRSTSKSASRWGAAQWLQRRRRRSTSPISRLPRGARRCE